MCTHAALLRRHLGKQHYSMQHKCVVLQGRSWVLSMKGQNVPSSHTHTQAHMLYDILPWSECLGSKPYGVIQQHRDLANTAAAAAAAATHMGRQRQAASSQRPTGPQATNSSSTVLVPCDGTRHLVPGSAASSLPCMQYGSCIVTTAVLLQLHLPDTADCVQASGSGCDQARDAVAPAIAV